LAYDVLLCIFMPVALSRSHAPTLWLRRIVAVIGGLCSSLGLAVLIGWYTHSIALIQLRPTLAPMQFNTALCFLLAGLALMAWGVGRCPKAILGLGGVVATVGSLTVAEYLCGLNLGIDQLLFHCYITTETSNIGRMSPVSALCFALAGVALLTVGRRGASRWRPLAVGSLASVVMSVSLIALLGYALGLPGAYGWAQLTRVAMHTAAGLCLVGTGLFIVAWSAALQPGQHSPRWLPVPLALAFGAASLVLYFALESKQDEVVAETIRAGAEGAKSQVAVRMESRILSLVRMSRDWEFAGAPAEAVWEANATDYVHDIPDMQALEWIDATRRVRWIAPQAGSEGELNNLIVEENRTAALGQADREHRPVVTRIVRLADGEQGFVIYAPIVVKGQQAGYLAGVFKAQACLERYLPAAVADSQSLSVSESGNDFFTRDAGTLPSHRDWVVEETISLPGAIWALRAWPTAALVSRLDSPLPAVVLCAGILGAALLGAASFYAQRASSKATALQAALDQVKTLEGMLPICSYCKRVRDDTGYWSRIETYIHHHSNASLSHGYCPECAAKAFRDFGFEVPEEIQAEFEAHNFE
jgi:sensor domain CHASE-containing protein